MYSIFDGPVDMTGRSTKKWEMEIARTQDPTLLCFGTADMDFQSAQPILDAIHRVADLGHLGYPEIQDSYYRAIENWLSRIGGWQIQARDCVSTNVGIYTSAWCVLDSLTQPGDEIIFQTPVHFCFNQMVVDNGRVPVVNPLRQVGESYTMDFDQLESCFTEKTKLFWLCNPHNPVGRAWNREELTRLAEICLRHEVPILSDDVYCGLIYPGHNYLPIAAISPEVSQNTITMYSTSKSYNTTGLRHSFVVTESPRLLELYNNSLRKLDLNYGMNLIGLATTTAAFNQCDDWIAQLMEYVQESHRELRETLARELPMLHVSQPDSTYFAWIDCRALGMDDQELERFFEQEAHVLVCMGAPLGKGGEGFIRINMGCPRSTLREGLNRIVQAVHQRLDR